MLAFLNLIIEIGYLVYLKIVDRDYWEENREKTTTFNKKLPSILKRRSVYVILSLIVIIVMLQIDGNHNLSRTTKNTFGFIVILFLIEFAVIFLEWFIKKRRDKNV